MHEYSDASLRCITHIIPVWAASSSPCVWLFCCCDLSSSVSPRCCCSPPPCSSLDDTGTTFTVIGNLDTVLVTPIGHTFKIQTAVTVLLRSHHMRIIKGGFTTDQMLPHTQEKTNSWAVWVNDSSQQQFIQFGITDNTKLLWKPGSDSFVVLQVTVKELYWI